VSTQIVQMGYDALAPRFGEWAAQVEGDPWTRYLDDLAARLPAGAHMLDLGCGNGSKLSRLGDRGFELTGVDIPREQLRLAGDAVRAATFVHGDFAEVDFEPERFDAVTALYSVVHVPREEHEALFRRIRSWLAPRGLFLASLSHARSEDWTGEWLGVEMFFSGHDAETNRGLIRDAGLELLRDELVWMREPEAEVAFLWVLVRRPS